MYSTLVWNRHSSGNQATFDDLDLMAYNRASQALLDSSDSALQNVEHMAVDFAGPVVLKVRWASETFGLGLSRRAVRLGCFGARHRAGRRSCSSRFLHRTGLGAGGRALLHRCSIWRKIAMICTIWVDEPGYTGIRKDLHNDYVLSFMEM